MRIVQPPVRQSKLWHRISGWSGDYLSPVELGYPVTEYADLWHSGTASLTALPLISMIMIMLQQLLSITQTAKRLRVRPEYVRQLVAKGRLSFFHGEQLDAADVERLAQLMNKLRGEGLAALVQITAEKNDVDET